MRMLGNMMGQDDGGEPFLPDPLATTCGMMAAVPDLGSVITAIVTPLDERLEVDEEAFVELMAHLARHGSDGFVVCGTTGEAPTLADDEHLRLVELAASERPAGTTIIAGTGSNDTRHACHMTERATELGADAILSVTPYYNKPNRCGLRRHYEEIARATDKPIVLYNIPSRVVLDLPNDFLAELAQIERIDYVKQANNDNLALVDGLGLYAGNDEIFARTLDIGGLGGVLVASHIVGDEMRRMVDEPDQRAEIDARLQDVWKAMGVTTNPIPVKAALNMLGHRVGGLRLPLVEADDDERAAIRTVLERHGLLQTAGA
jgi:4-hydroxy-tetrahydrodipicolinate synthase